jgi:hypothetical protein
MEGFLRYPDEPRRHQQQIYDPIELYQLQNPPLQTPYPYRGPNNDNASDRYSPLSRKALLSPRVSEYGPMKGIPLEPRWRQLIYFTLLFLITALWVTATVVYTFMSSSSKRPYTIFVSPEHTILALNIGSQISVFLLSEVVAEASDRLRWTLAARPEGVGLATFFGLGRATSLMGVVMLVFSRQRVGHVKWCLQRYTLYRQH